MPSMKVKITKGGNLIIEMDGFVGDACVTKAQEVAAALKAKGIIVNLDSFHRKDENCPETLVHVTQKAGN